jgi:hypothetical protein
MKKREDGPPYLFVLSTSAADPFSACKQGLGAAFAERADILSDRGAADGEVSRDCSDRDAPPMCQNRDRFVPLPKRPTLDSG